MSLVEILGDEVQGKSGPVKVETISAENEIVGIYFSAHWCPPCRGFTPKLVERYDTFKKAGKKFEIVFVSSDKDVDSFSQYYSEMPWLCVPFENRSKKEELSSKYGVRGIPFLVLLDAKTGETVKTNGRELLMNDENGSQFPYRS